MKVHIGTDRRRTVHSLTAKHAAESDIGQLPHLLHREETVLYGDPAYWKQDDREAFERRGVRYRINRIAPGANKNPGWGLVPSGAACHRQELSDLELKAGLETPVRAAVADCA